MKARRPCHRRIPGSLRNIENEHQSLTEIIIVNTMHERKMGMFERSDAFIVFPGGFGTMDEMFEILTWKQLQLHDKPVVIFNYEHYWDPLIALMKNIIETGFAQARKSATYYHVVDGAGTDFGCAGLFDDWMIAGDDRMRSRLPGSIVQIITIIHHSVTSSLTGRQWVFRDADERQVAACAQKHDLPECWRVYCGARHRAGGGGDIPESQPQIVLARSVASARYGRGGGARGRGDNRRRAHRHFRRLRCRRGDIIGVAGALFPGARRRADHLYSRPHEGRLRPERPGIAGVERAGRNAGDHGRLRHAGLSRWQAAHEAGLDVIVIDHHVGKRASPKAMRVVNPNRLDETSPHRQLAAVGVAFLLIVAVNRKLRCSRCSSRTRVNPISSNGSTSWRWERCATWCR